MEGEMEYEVITDDDLSGLEETVDRRLGEGWRLQGGVDSSVFVGHSEMGGTEPYYWYHQAMVKDSQKPEHPEFPEAGESGFGSEDRSGCLIRFARRDSGSANGGAV